MISEIKNSAQIFYQTYKKEMSYACIITGLALMLIAAGGVAVSSNVPDHINWYPSAVPEDMKDRLFHLLNADGLVTVGFAASIYAGLVLTIVGFCWRGTILYDESKRNPEADAPNTKPTEVLPDTRNREAINAKRLKIVGIVIGILGASVGIGMIAASTLIMQHSVHPVQGIVDTGSSQYPDYWTGHPFWSNIQSWVDLTTSHMHALLWGGIFTTIVGGGLVALALLQHKIRKHCCSEPQATGVES